MQRLAAMLIATSLIWGAATAVAQDGSVATAPQILVIDPERVYAESERGRAIRAELDAAAAAVQAENERIVAALTAEEKDLAARRPTMEPEDFRAEAEAFDRKAQDIRRDRDAKDRELTQSITEARAAFFEELRPIVGQIMIDRGGVAIMDSRSVYLALRAADITETAIDAIDAETASD